MKIVFTSDQSVTAAGFSATWDSIIIPEPEASDPQLMFLLALIALLGVVWLLLVIRLCIQRRNKIASVAEAAVSSVRMFGFLVTVCMYGYLVTVCMYVWIFGDSMYAWIVNDSMYVWIFSDSMYVWISGDSMYVCDNEFC
jgi:hypothetical protein